MYWATIYKAKSCYLAGGVIYRQYHSLESSSRSIRSCLSLKILVFARFGSNDIVHEVLSANSFIETLLQVLFHVLLDCCLSTAVSTDRTTHVRDGSFNSRISKNSGDKRCSWQIFVKFILIQQKSVLVLVGEKVKKLYFININVS